MAKALRGEAVVRLPRASNNTGHERLRSHLQSASIFLASHSDR